MTSKENGHLRELENACAKWTDERFYSRDDLRVVYMYERYLVNLLDDWGIQFRGDSFHEREPMPLLVIKVTIKEHPMVAFVSGRTRWTCYRIFLRRLEEDAVGWYPDRYA